MGELEYQLMRIANRLDRLTRIFGLWPVLGRAVLSGFGYVLGATLLIGIAIFIMERLTGIPIIGEISEFFLRQIEETSV